MFHRHLINRLFYNNLVGGVIALSVDQYKLVNGYSNMYWSWGGEDDDFGFRYLVFVTV